MQHGRIIQIHKWHLVVFIIFLVLLQLSLNTKFDIHETYRILTSSEIEIPAYINNNLIDKSEYFQLRNDNEVRLSTITPFYWHVAKAGGTAIKYHYARCYTIITASEMGNNGHEHDEYLGIVHANGSTNHMNVDTSLLDGILRAKELYLVQSHIPQLIYSPLFDESTQHLFDQDNQGIMFAMFRHPVGRVISLFYYLQEATWEPTYNPALVDMSLLEYANSELVEANFIVRALVNKFTGPLSPDDLNVAKDILRRKCIIGIIEDFSDSINAFDSYLNLYPNMNVYIEKALEHESRTDFVKSCEEKLHKGSGSNSHSHPKVDPESEEYDILKRKNAWDMQLWPYIQELYHEQQIRYKDLVDGIKNNES